MACQNSNHIHSQFRSLYRSILRELPARMSPSHTMLSNPSSLQRHVRRAFAEPLNLQGKDGADSERHTQATEGASSGDSSTHNFDYYLHQRLREGEQYLQYVRAQRHYLTLLERYNPGANLGEEERIRLTARRVGMELPDTDP